MKKKMLLYYWIFTVTIATGQKNNIQIKGTVMIDSVTAMKSTEVSLENWICFIVNNNFDKTLFPDYAQLDPNAVIIFKDLEKKHSFEYFQIILYRGKTASEYGEKGIHATKKIKKELKTDSNDFSLNIPITGISFEQAEKFCIWKENLVNQTKSKPVHISIPSIAVYKKVLQDKDSLNSSKCPQLNFFNCNCISTKFKNKHKAQGKSLVRVDSYWPSDLGLYNVQGNAAEMTSTKNIAMGGSFRHPANASYANQQQTYTGPADWLGFRYIVSLKN